MNLKITAISGLILVIYILLGSLIFWGIEHEGEKKLKDNVYKKYDKLKAQSCIPFTDFDEILSLAWSLPSTFDPKKNNSSPWQWDFVGSMFFSFVVVSTIGFGNQAPKTVGGRAVVILYSLFGIPIYLNVIARLSGHGKKLLIKIESKLSPKVNNYDFIIIAIFAFIFFVLIIMIPSALLMLSEDWTFHQALYFSFIALSTVGFGDYVAGMDQPDYFQFLLIIWMLAGLVYFTACISYLQFMLENLAKTCTRIKVVVVPDEELYPSASKQIQVQHPKSSQRRMYSKPTRPKTPINFKNIAQ